MRALDVIKARVALEGPKADAITEKDLIDTLHDTDVLQALRHLEGVGFADDRRAAFNHRGATDEVQFKKIKDFMELAKHYPKYAWMTIQPETGGDIVVYSSYKNIAALLRYVNTHECAFKSAVLDYKKWLEENQ